MLKVDLHAEWFISFLETTQREELEGIDILPKHEFRFLTHTQRTSGDKALSSNVRESYLTSHRVHQKLTVHRKT
jgi:hypothetical protein